MNIHTVTNENITANCNAGLDLFLSHIHKEGIVSEEQYNKLMQYRIVVAPTGFWGKTWWKLFYPDRKDDLRLHLVKVV